MALELRKAQRKRSKLKIGLSAPAGGGKTAGALILAYGLVKGEHPDWTDEQVWEKIAIVDTENGSGELYAESNIGKTHIGTYCSIPIEPPFEPQKAVEAIDACMEAGIECVIMDSMTHYWQGKGGVLEKQGNVAKRTGNSYTAWREVTPLHNAMIDAILQTSMHFICTLRSKMEYVQEKDERGKTTVRKVGLQPQQREGMEFEFSMFIEIDSEHNAFVSKDRTNVYDQQYFVITPEIGKGLAKWLDGGAAENTKSEVILTKVTAEEKEKANEAEAEKIIADISTMAKELFAAGFNKDEFYKVIESACGTKMFNKVKDVAKLKSAYEAVINMKVEE
jgi:hypothetical protein